MGGDSGLSLHDAEEELMNAPASREHSGETSARAGGPEYAEDAPLGRGSDRKDINTPILAPEPYSSVETGIG